VTYYRVAVMARLLPHWAIYLKMKSPELLLDGLTDEDFDLIDAQIEAIKKSG
jgi:hypothetical protein